MELQNNEGYSIEISVHVATMKRKFADIRLVYANWKQKQNVADVPGKVIQPVPLTWPIFASLPSLHSG